MVPELGELVDQVKRGRVPSAVCLLAQLRLLKMKGQILMNIKTACPQKQEKINTSASNMEDRKAYGKKIPG